LFLGSKPARDLEHIDIAVVMNRRRNVPPAPPIFQLLSDREDLRQQFAYIGLAGGPSRAARSAVDQLAVTIRDLDMEFTSDELESAFKFYSIHKSASEGPCNRYGNIFAFDRTAVSAPVGTTSGSDADTGKSLYLNANIVADGKGSWWAASQVIVVFSFHVTSRILDLMLSLAELGADSSYVQYVLSCHTFKIGYETARRLVPIC
jgi:hypothetical protein